MFKNKFLKTVFFSVAYFLTIVPIKGEQKNYWNQLNTEHYQLLFKKDFVTQAQKIANMLEYTFPLINRDLKRKIKKTIILNNWDMVCNAYVSSTNAMFYSCPSPNYNFVGSLDWFVLLGLHEARHILQNKSLGNGFLHKIINIIGGSIFATNYSVYFAQIPEWFNEGDAVCMETALSNYGRGSFPFYLIRQKLLVTNGKKLDYDKEYHHTNHDDYMNHYKLGFIMTSHMRRKYGNDAIKKIFDRLGTIKSFYFPLAVHNAVKKYPKEIFNDAMQELKELWQKQLEQVSETQSEKLLENDIKDYVDYYNPKYISDNEVIAIKIDKYKTLNFVLINQEKKKEAVLFKTRGLFDNTVKFSANKDYILMVKNQQLSLGDNSSDQKKVIVSYSLKNKKFKNICEGRYLCASLSNDNTYVIAVFSDKSYNHGLCLIDFKTGREIKRLKNPNNKMYFTPVWCDDDNKVVTIASENGCSSIEIIDVETEEVQVVFPPKVEHIGHAILKNGFVYYSSSYNGIDNVYAVEVSSGQIYQITSKNYGAFNPEVSNNTLIFSNYTINGLRLEYMFLNKQNWIPIGDVKNVDILYTDPIKKYFQDHQVSIEKVPNNIYEIKKYNSIRRSMVMTTYMIELSSLDKKTLKLTMIFDDLLNSWVKQNYGCEYSFKDGKIVPILSIEFHKLFPNVFLGADWVIQDKEIMEGNYNIKFDFPFLFDIHEYINSLKPNFVYQFTDTRNNLSTHTGILTFMLNGVSELCYLIPRKKYNIGFSTLHNLTLANHKTKVKDHIYGATCKFNVPSFIKNHIIVFKNVYQYKERVGKNIMQYGNELRNLDFINLKTIIIDDCYGNLLSSRLSYVFPIYKPELYVTAVYMQNISFTLSGEYIYIPESKIKFEDKIVQSLFTLGGEIYLNFILFNHIISREFVTSHLLRLGYFYSPTGYGVNNGELFHHSLRLVLSLFSFAKSLSKNF